MLWMIVPTGIERSGMALPGFMSVFFARDDRVARLKALRRDDVGLPRRRHR